MAVQVCDGKARRGSTHVRKQALGTCDPSDFGEVLITPCRGRGTKERRRLAERRVPGETESIPIEWLLAFMAVIALMDERVGRLGD